MAAERRIGTRRLRARMAEVLNRVRESGTPYVVERAGQPVAAVVPLDLYDKLTEEIRPPVPAEQSQKPSGGPYGALLALAGTMHARDTDVGRGKQRHLAEIYAGRRRRG